MSHAYHPVRYEHQLSGNAFAVEGHAEERSAQMLPSVVNFDEETTTGCVDLTLNDEMTEITWNTLGLAGSFSILVND